MEIARCMRLLIDITVIDFGARNLLLLIGVHLTILITSRDKCKPTLCVPTSCRMESAPMM